MRKVTIVFATIATAVPFLAQAGDDISGTYKLIAEQRTIVETGETVPVQNPLGYITYGKEGRMLALIVRQPRPKPEAIDKITDQQRADLLRTMTAYGGTYKFDVPLSIISILLGMRFGLAPSRSGQSRATVTG